MIRLEININDEAAAVLTAHAKRHNLTITETVRQAIGTWNFIKGELAAGNTIRVMNHTSGHEHELALPHT
ncbi:hypothetical protein GCM10009765_60120 [Fodinicola feengrottensis]|uniref:CopG family transcriptional regulator n=1 Tax=Fodinicola feengrottensis TaxID=435914 RepID=A0ABN2ICX7_9ACTN